MKKVATRIMTVVSSALLLVVGLAATAFAQTTDPVDDAVNDAFADLQGYATGWAPKVFTVAVILMAIGLGIKFLRRGKSGG
jgi:dipeptide/tripeptide permease